MTEYSTDTNHMHSLLSLVFHILSLHCSLILVLLTSKKFFHYHQSSSHPPSQQSYSQLQQLSIVAWVLFLADIATLSEYLFHFPNSKTVIDYQLYLFCNILKNLLLTIASGLYVHVGLHRVQLFSFKISPTLQPKTTFARWTTLLFAGIHCAYLVFAAIVATVSPGQIPVDEATVAFYGMIIFYTFYIWITIVNIQIDTYIIYFIVKTKSTLMCQFDGDSLSSSQRFRNLSSIKAARRSIRRIVFVLVVNVTTCLLGLALNFVSNLYGPSEFLARIYITGALICLHEVKELSSLTIDQSGIEVCDKTQPNKNQSDRNIGTPNIAFPAVAHTCELANKSALV